MDNSSYRNNGVIKQEALKEGVVKLFRHYRMNNVVEETISVYIASLDKKADANAVEVGA